jgi:crotonobetainyl-CoA:carnitine CoA-transferase CaiB-like acyl-CoA transferase
MNQHPKIMFSPVQEGLDVANDPQMIANKYVVEYEQPNYGKIQAVGYPVKFHATPAGVQGPSPEFGQHTK